MAGSENAAFVVDSLGVCVTTDIAVSVPGVGVVKREFIFGAALVSDKEKVCVGTTTKGLVTVVVNDKNVCDVSITTVVDADNGGVVRTATCLIFLCELALVVAVVEATLFIPITPLVEEKLVSMTTVGDFDDTRDAPR